MGPTSGLPHRSLCILRAPQNSQKRGGRLRIATQHYNNRDAARLEIAMRYYNNRDAARHVATNAPAPTVDGQRAGKGGDGDARGGIGMGDGRGNLRENREDPAPTVGRSEDAIAIQMSSHRPLHMPTPSAPHTASHEPRGFYNDAARRVVILPFAVSHLCPSGRK